MASAVMMRCSSSGSAAIENSAFLNFSRASPHFS